jgi:hypothetical protein
MAVQPLSRSDVRRRILLRGVGGLSVDFTLSEASGASHRAGRSVAVTAHAPDFQAAFDPRPVADGDLTRIAAFLHAAVTEEHPELTLPALSLSRSGIVFDVIGSSEHDVTLEIQLTGADEPEGLSFDTSRLALRHAALQFQHPDPAGSPATHRLFDPEEIVDFQSLIWDRVRLPLDSRLNGAVLSDRKAPAPGGQMGALWGLGFAPDCDADLELDLLRRAAPGAIAALIGTFADGDRFGVVLLQSDPLMDQEWLDTLQSIDSNSAGLLQNADPFSPTTGHRDAFYAGAFSRSTARAADAAVFATTAGWCLLSQADLTDHLATCYDQGADQAAAVPATLHSQLMALLGEAVGVPLPTVLAAHDCLLPGWDHRCEHDPIADALAAWMDGLVQPEQFLQFQVTDALRHPTDRDAPAGPAGDDNANRRITAPKPRYSDRRVVGFPEPESEPEREPEPEFDHISGGFESRFSSDLGPRAGAPAEIEAIFAWAQAADEATTDAGELDALESALNVGLALLAAGAPPGHEGRLRTLLTKLAAIFRPFDE